jgi:hypothetical protein
MTLRKTTQLLEEAIEDLLDESGLYEQDDLWDMEEYHTGDDDYYSEDDDDTLSDSRAQPPNLFDSEEEQKSNVYAQQPGNTFQATHSIWTHVGG